MKPLHLFILLFLTLSSIETAWSSPALKREFSETFYTHYEAGKCGENIAALAQRALAKGVDLRGAQAIVITNSGYLFSTTYRRDAGAKLSTPIGNIRFAPGIKNFYFHVALLKDGEIYDFDFGNHPEVLPAKEYIRRMFWEEPAVIDVLFFDRLRERKNYKISFVPIDKYLRELSAAGEPVHDLSDYDDSL